MLFLLRKIRRKLMQNLPTVVGNKFTTYLLYAVGEIVLVVIGIMIAVNLNNWNQDRKDRKRELQYLQNITIDLQKDLVSLDTLISFRRNKMEIADRLLAQMNGTPVEDLDQLAYDLNEMMMEQKFIPNNTTFSELSNSGNLNIISNDSIKLLLLGLTNLYDFNEQAIAHETFDYREYISKPTAELISIHKTFPIWEGKATTEELGLKLEDFDSILGSQKYENGVSIISLMSSFYIPNYLDIHEKSERIIQLINQELQN